MLDFVIDDNLSIRRYKNKEWNLIVAIDGRWRVSYNKNVIAFGKCVDLETAYRACEYVYKLYKTKLKLIELPPETLVECSMSACHDFWCKCDGTEKITKERELGHIDNILKYWQECEGKDIKDDLPT